ncbi:hypothetical protein SDC9_54765 [bioreactor metagenome]|uniref:Uncharacterized protein n=1 Tax=bioreactor metagenome TaxID=1076179 RepID=A0A644X2D5_9ZZZZ
MGGGCRRCHAGRAHDGPDAGDRAPDPGIAGFEPGPKQKIFLVPGFRVGNGEACHLRGKIVSESRLTGIRVDGVKAAGVSVKRAVQDSVIAVVGDVLGIVDVELQPPDQGGGAGDGIDGIQSVGLNINAVHVAGGVHGDADHEGDPRSEGPDQG